MPLLNSFTNKSIGTISLTSKSNRNALSCSALQELSRRFNLFLSDPSVKVIVIQSDVEGIFSSGHDLKEIHLWQTQTNEGNDNNNGNKKKLDELFRLCSQTMTDIVRCQKPVIAKIDGVATAAGCQLVASCDLAYASDRSTFATPGVNIGLFCSTPGVALGRAVGARKHAMEMLLTGNAITAAHAEHIGLINRAVPAKELDSYIDNLAEDIASKSQDAIRLGKPLFYEQLGCSDLRDAYDITSNGMVRGLLGEESKEGIDSFLTKRKPKWNE
mmetsp:Transcript_28730/g.43829  ORF Transcript_28730/g.43829 Transcript_28730/m.43829 type:complete len:272 (-) Transcript_28730:276-1091(-)